MLARWTIVRQTRRLESGDSCRVVLPELCGGARNLLRRLRLPSLPFLLLSPAFGLLALRFPFPFLLLERGEPCVKVAEHSRFTPEPPVPDDVQDLLRSCHGHVQQIRPTASPIPCPA